MTNRPKDIVLFHHTKEVEITVCHNLHIIEKYTTIPLVYIMIECLCKTNGVFNQDLSENSVFLVIDMSVVFESTKAFNQDVSQRDVSSLMS